MKIRYWTIAVLMGALALMGSAQEKQRDSTQQEFIRHPAEQLPLTPIERFSGILPTRRIPALSGARVVFRHWNIANDQRVEIEHEGALLVHLHSGEILATVGGHQTVYHGDDFWLVPAGEKLIVETSRDSVVLRTLDTIEH